MIITEERNLNLVNLLANGLNPVNNPNIQFMKLDYNYLMNDLIVGVVDMHEKGNAHIMADGYEDIFTLILLMIFANNTFANNDVSSARSKVASAIRATMMVTIPSAVGLAVLGKPIVDMLFSGEVDLAGQMLLMGTLSGVFYALSTLGNGILQGIGKMYVPIVNSAIALVVHLLSLWVMLSFMKLDIMAVVFSNIIFSLVMFILNHLAIRKFIGYRQELVKTFIIPLIVSVVMGAVSFGIYHLFHLFLPTTASCIIALVVAVVIYFVGMIMLKGFRESELARIPLVGKPLISMLKRFGAM